MGFDGGLVNERRRISWTLLALLVLLPLVLWIGGSSLPFLGHSPARRGLVSSPRTASDTRDANRGGRVGDGETAPRFPLEGPHEEPSTSHGPERVIAENGETAVTLFFRRLGAMVYEEEGLVRAPVLDAAWRLWEVKEGPSRPNVDMREWDGGAVCLVRTADSPPFLARCDELEDAANWIRARTRVTRFRIRGRSAEIELGCHELVFIPDDARAKLEGGFVVSRGALVGGEPVATRVRLPLSSELRTGALHVGVTYRIAVEVDPRCEEVLGPRLVPETAEITPPGTFELSLRPARGVEIVLDGAAGDPVRFCVRARSDKGGARLEGSLSAGRAWVSCEALADGEYEVSAFGPDWASEAPNPSFRVRGREPTPNQIVLHPGDSADAGIRLLGIEDWNGVPEVWARSEGGVWETLATQRTDASSPFVRWHESTLLVYQLRDPLDVALRLPGLGIARCLELVPSRFETLEVAPIPPREFAAARNAALSWVAQHPERGRAFLERAVCGSPDGPWITIRYFNLALDSYLEPGEWLLSFDDSGRYRLRIHPADGAHPVYVPVLP